jgi:hypothetical protein
LATFCNFFRNIISFFGSNFAKFTALLQVEVSGFNRFVCPHVACRETRKGFAWNPIQGILSVAYEDLNAYLRMCSA